MNRLSLPTILPELTGATIILRPMHERDTAALFAIYGDPVVMRYTDETPFASPDTVALMLHSVRTLLERGESLEWALALKDDDRVIGTCGLHSVDHERLSAEVGCLLHRRAWGRGYMAQAIGLLMDYATDVLGLTALSADVAPANIQACRLFRKLGYSRQPDANWRIDLHPAA